MLIEGEEVQGEVTAIVRIDEAHAEDLNIRSIDICLSTTAH